jgi:hypothetical protein
VLACALLGAAASAAPKPQWLIVRGFWDGSTGPEPVGTASGRGWMGFFRSPTRWELGSLRRSGGKLSFARATVAAQRPIFIVGSQLVYHLPDISGKPGDVRTAPLLPNGTVGAPRALAGDPEKLAPQELDPVITTGVQVGGRTVWLLSGAKVEGGNLKKEYRWACCTSTGELSDLTAFVRQGKLSFFWQFGVDSKKRLWLAWLEAPSNGVVGAVKLLELEPETLAPRTSTAATLPGARAATAVKLSCAALCRVVMTDLFTGNLLASSPGGRVPIKMASGSRQYPATLLGASDSAGRLTAAYISTRLSPQKQVQRIEIVRGDARGANARTVASLDLPDGLEQQHPDHVALYATAVGTFAPGGLVYFGLYRGEPNRVLGGQLGG